jgi:hypothetical protein
MGAGLHRHLGQPLHLALPMNDYRGYRQLMHRITLSEEPLSAAA